MAKSTKVIISVLIIFGNHNSSFSQDVASCYKFLLDSININKYTNIYLYTDSGIEKQDSIFDQWLQFGKMPNKLIELDSFWLSTMGFQDTFKYFDSSFKRINYKTFRSIEPEFIYDKKDIRQTRKRSRLLKKWMRIAEKDNLSDRLEMINRKMHKPKYIILLEKVSFQKPILIIPYYTIIRNKFKITSISTIHNGVRNIYYRVSLPPFGDN